MAQYGCPKCGKLLPDKVTQAAEVTAMNALHGVAASTIIAGMARCPACGHNVNSDELLPRQKSGLLSALGRLNPASTAGAIGVAAHACHSKYPKLTFRHALEQSLIRTRPGWDDSTVKFISGRLDRAKCPNEMIQVAAAFDDDRRRQKWGR